MGDVRAAERGLSRWRGEATWTRRYSRIFAGRSGWKRYAKNAYRRAERRYAKALTLDA